MDDSFTQNFFPTHNKKQDEEVNQTEETPATENVEMKDQKDLYIAKAPSSSVHIYILFGFYEYNNNFCIFTQIVAILSFSIYFLHYSTEKKMKDHKTMIEDQ